MPIAQNSLKLRARVAEQADALQHVVDDDAA